MLDKCRHDWTRTNAVTTDDGYDTFKCDKCPATGKSFGIGGVIVADAATIKRKATRSPRGPYFKTIRKRLRRGGWFSDGREWSRQRYEERIARGEVDPNA